MRTMTLEEKIGQLMMVEQSALKSVADISQYFLGSVLWYATYIEQYSAVLCSIHADCEPCLYGHPLAWLPAMLFAVVLVYSMVFGRRMPGCLCVPSAPVSLRPCATVPLRHYVTVLALAAGAGKGRQRVRLVHRPRLLPGGGPAHAPGRARVVFSGYAVHGHGLRGGATVFPPPLGAWAANNATLAPLVAAASCPGTPPLLLARCHCTGDWPATARHLQPVLLCAWLLSGHARKWPAPTSQCHSHTALLPAGFGAGPVGVPGDGRHGRALEPGPLGVGVRWDARWGRCYESCGERPRIAPCRWCRRRSRAGR